MRMSVRNRRTLFNCHYIPPSFGILFQGNDLEEEKMVIPSTSLTQPTTAAATQSKIANRILHNLTWGFTTGTFTIHTWLAGNSNFIASPARFHRQINFKSSHLGFDGSVVVFYLPSYKK